ncbi:MAG: 50S ribosomal protein L15, partial [Bacteroidales bacterium]|nr:50S ribosomal protein L15 [Bacteroidales bacterium]
KTNKRIGRGQGSGRGGTATRGHKGAQSRSGYKQKKGFEGGQMPLYRRVPKGGFKNINRVEYNAINVSTLQNLFETKGISVFNMEVLIENGLTGRNDLIKILANGNLSAKIEVHAHAFSAKAVEMIEGAAGVATKI